MATHKFRDAVQRGGALLTAAGMLAALAVTAFPAHIFADALNPLTERSLTLSSSSPGWSYKDGSNNETYAPPNSGANGKKTGNTFQFRVSTSDPNNLVKAISFQYCTKAAGVCIAPGNNASGQGAGKVSLTQGSDTVTGDGSTQFETQFVVGSKLITESGRVYTVESITNDNSLTITENADETETAVDYYYRSPDSDSTSDLDVVFPSMDIITDSDWTNILNSADKTPDPDGSEGEFVVLTRDHRGTGSGTIDLTSGSAAVTGTNTKFTEELTVGSEITTQGGKTYTVASIASDTSLTLTGNASDNEDDATFTYVTEGPANKYTTATDWVVTATNKEDGTIANRTGRDNYITMTSSTGLNLDAGDYIKVIFFGTHDNYITNPGAGAFFVRMNTYADEAMTQVIDGGVTVANVMNESIWIQTKVLETMEFSVGTHDPTTYTNAELAAVGEGPHAQCAALLMAEPDPATYATAAHNVVKLGSEEFEYSLATDEAHDGISYWRLSSNSSAGATVYYTGHTLTNTVGDEITPLDDVTPDGHVSKVGTEQFGLAIAYESDTTILGGTEAYLVWNDDWGDDQTSGTFAYFVEQGPPNGSGYEDSYAHLPRLYPLVPLDPYDGGAGDINDGDPYGFDAKFAFNPNADTFAIPIATENDQVVNCVTAKMRYIANIAATTPAGIYTTKINYVAAPQY
ncbi:hypothetical protein IRY61_02015 [Candidatus Saccharibacteria bacterium]|nr:hypothetical protein [Candidatus Saccharibacteria bacterium]